MEISSLWKLSLGGRIPSCKVILFGEQTDKWRQSHSGQGTLNRKRQGRNSSHNGMFSPLTKSKWLLNCFASLVCPRLDYGIKMKFCIQTSGEYTWLPGNGPQNHGECHRSCWLVKYLIMQ